MKNLIGEFIGTFFLVFIGTGAIVLHQTNTLILGTWGIAFAFGGIVTLLIYTMRNHFFTHLNPAVSIAKFLTRETKFPLLAALIITQCLGAVIASVILKQLAPTNPTLGATLLHVSPTIGFIIEFVATTILIFSIQYRGVNTKKWHLIQPAIIGTIVLLEAGFLGPFTGASMNPARSFGPAMVSGNWEGAWLYWVAPIFGAFVGILLSKLLNSKYFRFCARN